MKTLTLTWTGILGSMLLATPSWSQDGPPPEELVAFPGVVEHPGMDDQIFPYGWTIRNRLALVKAFHRKASDYRHWEFQIFDPVRDETRVLRKFQVPGEGDIAEFWVRYGKEVEDLALLHLIRRAGFEKRQFPAVEGPDRQDHYELEVDRMRTLDASHGHVGIRNLRLSLVRNGEEIKEVLRQEWQGGLPRAAGVAGYFVDEAGERMYVMLGLTGGEAWEGVYPRSLTLVGCGIGEQF